VRELQDTGEYPREALLRAGFVADRSGRQLEALQGGGLFGLQQRLQGPGGLYQVMPITEPSSASSWPKARRWTSRSRPSAKACATCASRACIKVRSGVTTLEEVISVTNE
jgi:type IV pilus assembly protein PilB